MCTQYLAFYEKDCWYHSLVSLLWHERVVTDACSNFIHDTLLPTNTQRVTVASRSATIGRESQSAWPREFEMARGSYEALER